MAMSETTQWYRSKFEQLEKTLNGESSLPFHVKRRDSMAAFSETGFPTTKHEEWRFTNVAPIAKGRFAPVLTYRANVVTKETVERNSLGMKSQLVFVDGHFAQEFSKVGSLPSGAVVGSLAKAMTSHAGEVQAHVARYASPEGNPFISLNTAFVQDGAFILVPDGVHLDDTIHLLFIATGSDALLVNLRNLIIVGNDARATIVESYIAPGGGSYLTNVVTEVVAGEGSVIEHDKLQDESLSAYHIAALQVQQQGRSVFTSNSIALGGAIVRNNVTAVLGAEHGECTLNGLSLSTGEQLIDNHTTIDHALPNCASHELYKAIIDGRSRGVFNGKIFVRKDAQKTDAKQTNKTLLLSDDGVMDTKPQLEIFADDVKCTHGATVGQLDPDQVFYLRTRGIDATAAADILTFAFAGDIVDRIHVDTLRSRLKELVHRRLHEGRARG